MVYEATGRMCAVIFTKAFTNVIAWRHACDLIQIVDPSVLPALVRSLDRSHDVPARSSTERGARGGPNSDIDDYEAALSTLTYYKEGGTSINHPFIDAVRDTTKYIIIEKGKSSLRTM